MTTPESIDAYIASFDDRDVAERLQRIREVIEAQVPDSEEKIRYGMPAIMLGGRYALHFAGWKKHIGLYPVPPLGGELETEVAPFRTAKDSVVFPHRAPVPYELIGRITASIVARRREAGEVHPGHSPEPHIPAAGEASVPEIEVDENVAPRPEEEIADVARAEPDTTDHGHPRTEQTP